jgi:hypothetical protein
MVDQPARDRVRGCVRVERDAAFRDESVDRRRVGGKQRVGAQAVDPDDEHLRDTLRLLGAASATSAHGTINAEIIAAA